MASDSEGTDDDLPSGRSSDSDDEARVLLFMRSGRDRELVAEAIGDRFRVEVTTDAAALESTFDCCVFGTGEFDRVAGAIEPRRSARRPPSSRSCCSRATTRRRRRRRRPRWDHADDVVELPVRKRALRTRIGNLVERRHTSLRLAARERKLADTVDDLRLKERAMNEAPVGITIAESGDDGNPIVYEGFEALTGYGSEVLGRDCRFLQGEGTNPETRAATLREAIDDERPASVDILNYRCNGQQFWNRLTVAPISDADGEVTHYVGFQTDITDRKIRERRLEVMNRVLDHNLRNKMNLLAGYADLLRSDLDDPDALKSVEVIAETTDDLMRIATAARKIDHTLSAPRRRRRAPGCAADLATREPDARSVPRGDDHPLTPRGRLARHDGRRAADGDRGGVENAIKHNDSPNPAVDVRVERRSPEWLAVEITDNGPGIPDHETRVLDRGETPLTHADRLGIWLIYWVVSKAGGEFSVDTSAEGTTLRLVVPANP